MGRGWCTDRGKRRDEVVWGGEERWGGGREGGGRESFWMKIVEYYKIDFEVECA